MENKFNAVDQFCMSCLCVGRTLYQIDNESLKEYYMDIINEIPLCAISNVIGDPKICFECVAILKKVMKFREQVKDSYRILLTYISNENLQEFLLTDVSRSPRLKVQKNEVVVSIPSSESVEPEETPSSQLVYVKSEVKREWDVEIEEGSSDNFDFKDDDEKHVDVEDESKNVVKEKKKKKGTERKLRSKKKKSKKIRIYEHTRANLSENQKIKTIELTYDEMQSERENEIARDDYIKSKYKCETCIVGFNYVKSYEKHNKEKHSSDIGEYKCPICNIVVSTVDVFTAHYKRHMTRYECSLCNKRTQNMKAMHRHYFTNHQISLREYNCDVCGKISNSIDNHRNHKETHKARLQCPECDKTFSHRSGLMNHKHAVHEHRNVFACTQCDKVFKWKTSYRRHVERHESKTTSASVAYCISCNVSFSSVFTYQRHLKHSLKHVTQDQFKYICDHCNRRFADKTKLRDHIEEKHLNRKFQCHICLKPSKNRVALDQHIRNIHKGRPNNKICHHCGKGFPTKVQLESHIRTHTRERPFICEYCPTTFSQQSNLYKHNRQVHLNVKSKRPALNKKEKEKVCSSIVAANQTPAEEPRPIALFYTNSAGFVV